MSCTHFHKYYLGKRMKSTLNHDDSIGTIAGRFDGIVWTDVVTRAQACPHLPEKTLLHAGPPLTGEIPTPIRAAAIESILYEAWASDAEQAAQLLETQAVTLLPAQDHGVVTPLAQVVSPSMPVFCVSRNEVTCYAPLVESGPPALRFGKPAASARVQLRLISHLGLHVLSPLLKKQPVAIAPLINHALTGGEECHALTARANVALVTQLEQLPVQDKHVILSNPGFVLPLLMAASAVHLKELGQIVAAGGNSQCFGYRVRGSDAWHLVAGSPPQGTRFPGHENTAALNAIGDSAVIDFSGLGAQALVYVPSLSTDWKEVLPADLAAQRKQVLDASTGIVSIDGLKNKDASPMVNLAILDRDAQAGLIGRGVYRLPVQSLTDGAA